MAQQQHQDTPTIGFRSIQLLKTQTLGIGSYGSVCKALCDDLLCAAKIIHPTLFDPNAHQRVERQREHRLPISRFMQECEFMSAIRHPNIIQYLGMHQDPETKLPVLLMELMDDSLTHFLESSQDAVPYHIQVNFCHNITLAISFLHSNGITHRDLSSNNVLLRGNVQAKVTDFGMAKLGDKNPRATRVSFTMCPGTEVYMPPEAVKDKPVYTAKIDCFGIGTLIIQILTRRFPDPGERQKAVHIDHPQFPGGIVFAPIPEIERRQNHISQVDPNHPLLPIALDCLKDSDVDRPSAQELCHRVAAQKETPQFTENLSKAPQKLQLDNTTETEELIRDLQQQLEVKYEETRQMEQEYAQQIQQCEDTIAMQINSLRQKDDIIQHKDYVIRQKDQFIEENKKLLHLQHVSQELEPSQHITAQFQTQIQQLEQQLKRPSPTEVQAKTQPSLRDPPQTHHTTNTSQGFTLEWRQATLKAPSKMYKRSDAVVHGDTVYLGAGEQTIYAYNSTERNETWIRISHNACEIKDFSLAIVNNLLTIIGGRDSGGRVTNKLVSRTWDSTLKNHVWRERFHPMPTKRSLSIAVCTGQALIVAGGLDQHRKTLRTIEVMDIEKWEWTSVVDLPEPLIEASITICDDRIYITGGLNHTGYTKSVYMCTLADLFQSCQSRKLRLHLTQSVGHVLLPTSRPRYSVWNRVADLPVTLSTCVALHSRLIAIGGYDSNYTPMSDVCIYHHTSNTWEVISKMNISRRSCFAAVLPTNEIIVVGGHTSGWNSETDSVEIATIV